MIKVRAVLIVHDKRQNTSIIKKIKYATRQYCTAFKLLFYFLYFIVDHLLKNESWRYL